MAEKNPLDEVLNKITDILSEIQTNQKKIKEKHEKGETIPHIPLTPEIYDQLENLEIQAALIKENVSNIMKELGKEPQELNETIQNPPETMDPKQRRLLERAARIKDESESLHQELSRAIHITAVKAKKQKIKEEKGKKPRGRKFRDDSKWIPL